MARSLISLHYRFELARLGYPIDDIQYCLSFSQGDGMAFYGRISSLDTICQRLLADSDDQCNLALSALTKGMYLDISRCNWSYRYNHFNTMMVLVSNESFPETISEEETNAVELLRQRISEDIKEVSKQLELAGYHIIDATPYEKKVVREFCTKQFKVKIEEHPESELILDHWDDSEIEPIIQDIVNGKKRYFRVIVEVQSREYGQLLGHNSLGSIIDNIDYPSRSYHGYKDELIANSIDEARKAIEELSKCNVAA